MKSRLPEGYGTKGMNNMLKQAEKMQEQVAALQLELNEREYSAWAGGGMVQATVKGDKRLSALEIKPEVIDPGDADMLSDLIIAAVNEAGRVAEEDAETAMEKITGPMGLGGLL